MFLIFNDFRHFGARRRFIRGLFLLLERVLVTCRRHLAFRGRFRFLRTVTCRDESQASGVGGDVDRASSQDGLCQANGSVGVEVGTVPVRRVFRGTKVEDHGLASFGPERAQVIRVFECDR